MGKYDKDRFQKELAIRYCLARGLLPFLEVVVRGVSDLSDSVEVITDIDVLGLNCTGDGTIQRTIFDCKTLNKMSPINRAFWASGLRQYAGCNDAFVILKTKAVHNHRISALSIDVDLHDEESFIDLGKTLDMSFPSILSYQSSIEGWNSLFVSFEKNIWTEKLFDLSRNIIPLSKSYSSNFRKIIAELRLTRGNFDPDKNQHIAVLFDIIASTLVLWIAMARDIRRFYEPSIKKESLENILRYYMWGGKDSYSIRQQMREKSHPDNAGVVEFPAWDQLFKLCGLIISSPQSLQGCAYICRELSIRCATGPDDALDGKLAEFIKGNSRYRQFIVAMTDYLVAASGLPQDIGRKVQKIAFEIKA
jgi:hypothetical protein